MTGPTRRAVLAAAVLLLAASPGAGQPHARPRPPRPPAAIAPGGTEVFRWLLKSVAVEPLSAEGLETNPFPTSHVIVIVLGDAGQPIHGKTPVQWAAHVVRSGGAALVASDTRLDFPPDSARAFPHGVTVTGETVTGTLPKTLYRGSADCPIVVPRAGPEGGGPEWELFKDLRVATSSPSYLRVPKQPGGEFRSRLAAFPPGCQAGTLLPLDPDTHPFAVGGSGGPRADAQPFAFHSDGPHHDRRFHYRFLAVADPSIFINQMLIPQPDAAPTDNLLFATRVVTFLRDGPRVGPRTHCLFIQNGQVIDKFKDLEEILRPPPPLPPLPDLHQVQQRLPEFVNHLLDQAQENDAVNGALIGREPDRQPYYLREFITRLLTLGCLWAGWLLVRKVWKARQPADGPPAPPSRRAAPRREPGGVFDRRERELLRRNNLYEPVRAAVRELFASAGAPPDAGPKLPPVETAPAVGRPDTLRQALADLWAIGYGPPVAVTPRRWDRLAPVFGRARQALADGKWWFAAAGPDRGAANGSEA